MLLKLNQRPNAYILEITNLQGPPQRKMEPKRAIRGVTRPGGVASGPPTQPNSKKHNSKLHPPLIQRCCKIKGPNRCFLGSMDPPNQVLVLHFTSNFIPCSTSLEGPPRMVSKISDIHPIRLRLAGAAGVRHLLGLRQIFNAKFYCLYLLKKEWFENNNINIGQ